MRGRVNKAGVKVGAVSGGESLLPASGQDGDAADVRVLSFAAIAQAFRDAEDTIAMTFVAGHDASLAAAVLSVIFSAV